MDYHSIHGYDKATFTIPDTHRLPTVSASQALDDLTKDTSSYISTGLSRLDTQLLGASGTAAETTREHGGVKIGQITEIWGPPGSGKTAVGMQLAANALCGGNGVVWIDCLQDIQENRLLSVVKSVKDGRGSGSGKQLGRLAHYACHSLPHLLALISRPTSQSFSPNDSLIVISSMSALVNAALPKGQGLANNSSKPGKGSNPTFKRIQSLQYLAEALRKIAATKNCAVVVLSQCATKMRSEGGATLIPAVNATVWEQAISTRIALFKDWAWHDNAPSTICLASIQKMDGKIVSDPEQFISGFTVDTKGVSAAQYDSTLPALAVSKMTQQKRKLGQTEFEVPDSEGEDDEDYGWAEEDEAAMPPPPPQWQGSEDILLGQEVGRSEAGSGSEEDEVQSIGEDAEL